jgi:Protein of unknown function (DUF3300)
MTALAKLLRRSCAIVTSGALVLSGLPAMAQDQSSPPRQQLPAAQQAPQAERLGRGQLEKLLAPIALYPDDLVAQILTASTYPLEVVQAARWVNEHSNVQGEALQDAMQQQPWDASVKGLTAVPQVLAMMNDKLDWTQQVGEAFLAQPDDLSNAIQQLRAKATANGNLKSSKQLKVSSVAASAAPPPAPPPPGVDSVMLPPPPPANYITIEPVDPGLYYVPIYDPMVVYGPWPWADYAPFYWYPPGYVLGAAVIGFGVGFFAGAALWCHFGWGSGGVAINVARYNQFNRTNLAATAGGFSHWQFNAAHRGTVGFQNAKLRQQFGTTAAHGTLPTATHGTFQGTLQGNRALSVNRGGTGPLNTKANTNLNVERNANVNRSLHANSNLGVDKNLSVNKNVNKNVNPSTMNPNRGMNVSHGASFAGGGGRHPPGKPHR